MTIRLPSLPYPLDALEPHVSAETLELHHGRHHRSYVETLNRLLDERDLAGSPLADLIRTQEGPVFENAAQAWNHAFYWHSMAPPPAPGIVDGPLLSAIQRDIGGPEELRDRFKEAALSRCGSGWAWLVQGTDGHLEVAVTKDAGCPLRVGLRPLIVCDLWEHAYYLDHRNKRGSYLDAWWEIANWAFAEENLQHGPDPPRHSRLGAGMALPR